MYPVSEAYKAAIARDERAVCISGTITLKDASVINISDADIVQGSLYFTEQCVTGEDIEIGNVYASEMGLSLNSPPENPYSLDGARIILNFGIDTSSDGSGVYEYVPLGYFYVTEIERKHTAVGLKALDGMILFDMDLAGVLTTGGPYLMIQSCCDKVGVDLATTQAEFNAFPNAARAFNLPTEESNVETCRDLIMWLCQLTGTFARMNRLGQLEIVPVTAGTSVKTISKPERFTSDVSDFYVKITKVTMKVGEEEYSQGTAGMTLALEENPLMADKSEAEINAALAEILAQVTEAEYTPYNLTCAGDPALQAGDWVKLTGVSNINGPEFEYSRNSPAIHPETGEEIPEDTPVFVDFAGGKKGSLMVDGTENIIDFNAPTRGQYHTVSQKGNIDNFTAWEIETTRETTSSECVFWQFDAVSGQKYTASIIVYDPQDCFGRIRLLDYGNFDTTLLKDNMEYLGNDLYRGIITVESGATQKTSHGFLSYFAAGKPTGSKYWVYAGQVENKEYDTPYQIGTRANPVKQITLPEALPEEFGVGVRFKPLWDSETYDLMDYRTIFMMGYDITSNIVRVMRYTNNRWDLRVYADGDGAYTRFERSFNAGEIIGFYIVKKGTRAKVFYAQENGESYESDWFSVGETFTDEKVKNIFIGSSYGGTIRHAGGVIADFVLHDSGDIDPEGYLAGVPDDADGGGES